MGDLQWHRASWGWTAGPYFCVKHRTAWLAYGPKGVELGWHRRLNDAKTSCAIHNGRTQ